MDNFANVLASQIVGTKNATFLALAANSTYYARVRAINIDNHETVNLTLPTEVTMASQPIAGVPPYGNVTTHSIDAFWTSANPAGTRFVVESFWMGGPGPSTTTANANTATIDGLSPVTSYDLWVSAINHEGVLTSSTFLGSTTTLPTSIFISSPTNLIVQRPVSGLPDRLELSWKDNSSGPGEESVFAIFQWSDTDPVTEVANVPGVLGSGTVVTSTITNLLPNKRYYFYVTAKVAAESSLPSNVDDEVTWAEVPQWSVSPIGRTDKTLTAYWTAE